MRRPKKKPAKAKSEAAKKKEKRKKKKHAKYLKDNQIQHFARFHPDCGNTGAARCNAYDRKLGSAPGNMNQPYEAAVHHVMPVAAVIYFMKLYKGDDCDNIASVYSNIDWCINIKDNLVWLPYFGAYQRHLYLGQAGSAPSAMAAHNFDHNPHYNDLVINKLKPFWEEIAAQKPADECAVADDIKKTLEKQGGLFRTNLTIRGTQPILNRAQTHRSEGARTDDLRGDPLLHDWWKTFSMAPGKAKERSHRMLLLKPPRQKMLLAIKRATEAGS